MEKLIHATFIGGKEKKLPHRISRRERGYSKVEKYERLLNGRVERNQGVLSQGAEAKIILVELTKPIIPDQERSSTLKNSQRRNLAKPISEQSILSGAKQFIIKDRIPKSYRIKELDDKIRRLRTRSETKLLVKAGQLINVPQPITINNNSQKKEVINNPSSKGGREGIPENNFQILMPFIDGEKLSEHLDALQLTQQKAILKQIGKDVAKLHDANIIHGDLTTSNMILNEKVYFLLISD